MLRGNRRSCATRDRAIARGRQPRPRWPVLWWTSHSRCPGEEFGPLVAFRLCMRSLVHARTQADRRFSATKVADVSSRGPCAIGREDGGERTQRACAMARPHVARGRNGACARRRARWRGAPFLPAARVPSSARARAHGAWRAWEEGDPPPPPHFRVLACALRALRACAARRAQRRGAPPLRAARVRVSADLRAPRSGGGERGTGTYHPHHHRHHPTCTRTCTRRPASNDRVHRPEQARRTSPAASQHLEGGRGGAEERRQLQPPPPAVSRRFDCFCA